MKLTIRVRSPQLKRLLARRLRVEKLPPFAIPRYGRKHASPLAVWVGSLATVVVCLCLAMVASMQPNTLSGLSQVSQSLIDRVSPTPAVEPELARPPESSFPYGSLPPMQAEQGPVPRAGLAWEGSGLAGH
jgi:hypothetical protein